MEKSEYKNSKESKRKITSAYLQLLKNNTEDLNVTNIVRKAKINRGTFYLHFNNIQDVGKYIETELANNFKPIENMFRQIELDKCPEVILKKLNETLLNDLDYYKLMFLVANNSNVMESIKNSIVATISNNFKVMNYVTSLDHFNIVVQYLVGGVISAYSEWLKGKIGCDLDKLSNYLARLIKNSLKECINASNSNY